MELLLKANENIKLPMKQGDLQVTDLLDAASRVNSKLRGAANGQIAGNLDLYEIIDLRMLSGMIGEMYTAEIADAHPCLMKNPNLDGYPDLCDISCPNTLKKLQSYQVSDFLHFAEGGFEVKNTFGVKKSNTHVLHRSSRVSSIGKRLVWKAHHRETNHLLALFSDYVDRIPQIVACFYSDNLLETDWTVKQQPKAGSTMTSFCQTTVSAYEKLQAGILFCGNKEEYESFTGN